MLRFCFFLFVLVTIAKASDEESGSEEGNDYAWSLYRLSQRSVMSDSICNKTIVDCQNCTTVSVCVEGTKQILINCLNPNPYCDNGGCSPTMDEKCAGGGADGGFTCQDLEGTFPDGSDCGMYHMCLNGSNFNYRCELSNTVYSPITKSCVKQSIQNKCVTMKCSQDGIKIPYPLDPSMYFLCINLKPSILYQCPEDSAFNQKSQKCEPSCSKEGPIADPDNRKQFIECILNIGTTYKQVLRTCPQSEENGIESYFNPERKQCELVGFDSALFL